MVDFDYVEELLSDNNEAAIYIVPILQQFDDWAEQNRFWYKCARVWKRAAKKWYEKYLNLRAEKDTRLSIIEYWKDTAASRLDLLRRAAEFLEINNPILKEIKKELGDGN